MSPANAPDPFQTALDAAITPTTYLEAAHRAVLHAATLAPSVHNTQPWRFTRDDDGLDMYADDSRRLPVLDPEGRQVILSCGAALLHAQVAARALGFLAVPELLPETADPAHLARLHLTAGTPPSALDRQLADAILLRHTYRDAFDGCRLSDDLLTRLRLAAEQCGAILSSVADDDLIELEVLLSWADGIEEHDALYRAELAAALRTGPSDDGIPATVLPSDPQRGSSLRLREFAPGVPPSSRDTEPPVAERPDVVLIVTDDDSRRSWLQAGQALGAVLLHAAHDGVMGQPLAQATDFPMARIRLRKALGLVGTPQMALRLGYATDAIATPRRAVDEVLDIAGPAKER